MRREWESKVVRDTEIQRYRDTRTEIQRYRDTENEVERREEND
jgi:hypothetical protein